MSPSSRDSEQGRTLNNSSVYSLALISRDPPHGRSMVGLMLCGVTTASVLGRFSACEVSESWNARFREATVDDDAAPAGCVEEGSLNLTAFSSNFCEGHHRR
jgi:hypothetical protein